MNTFWLGFVIGFLLAVIIHGLGWVWFNRARLFPAREDDDGVEEVNEHPDNCLSDQQSDKE